MLHAVPRKRIKNILYIGYSWSYYYKSRSSKLLMELIIMNARKNTFEGRIVEPPSIVYMSYETVFCGIGEVGRPMTLLMNLVFVARCIFTECHFID